MLCVVSIRVILNSELVTFSWSDLQDDDGAQPGTAKERRRRGQRRIQGSVEGSVHVELISLVDGTDEEIAV